MRLKYGCNPHQSFAALEPIHGGKLPVELLSGTPSLINLLDALNAWQLVAEAARGARAGRRPRASSTSRPPGAAVAVALPDDLVRAYEVRRTVAHARRDGLRARARRGSEVLVRRLRRALATSSTRRPPTS